MEQALLAVYSRLFFSVETNAMSESLILKPLEDGRSLMNQRRACFRNYELVFFALVLYV
jgi:hypothetical protein